MVKKKILENKLAVLGRTCSVVPYLYGSGNGLSD
jgi:hypothetical protein